MFFHCCCHRKCLGSFPRHLGVQESGASRGSWAPRSREPPAAAGRPEVGSLPRQLGVQKSGASLGSWASRSREPPAAAGRPGVGSLPRQLGVKKSGASRCSWASRSRGPRVNYETRGDGGGHISRQSYKSIFRDGIFYIKLKFNYDLCLVYNSVITTCWRATMVLFIMTSLLLTILPIGELRWFSS